MRYQALAAVLILSFILMFTSACKSSTADESIFGTWQMYGAIESTDLSDYENISKGDIITGEEYQTTFGAPVPDNTITLTKKGVKEYLDLNGKGSEVSGWERTNDNQYRLTVTIHELLGEKPLDDPIEQQIFYTLADGFLYEEFSPVELGALGSDNENYNINVYTRAK